ncbi:MAG: T9SS type A sorting domain-containing protein [Chitinophagales bacterium]
MKAKFTLVMLFVAAFAGLYAQQAPNSGFETWTNAANPDGWVTIESIFGAPFGLASKDTVVKAEGTASLKLKTDSIQAGPTKRLVAGIASLGTGAYSPTTGFSFDGIAFHFRPDTLFFTYKLTSPGTDTGSLSIYLYTGSATQLGGGLYLNASANFATVYVPLTAQYSGATIPDSLNLQITSSNVAPVQGTTLNIDAIRFGYVNAPSLVEEIDNSITMNVFPNPAANYTNVTFSEPMNNSSIMVFDLTGRVVTHELVNGSSHQFNTGDWATGTYTFSLINADSKVVGKGRINVAH